MIKYRRLNRAELESMEREFVLFLVTQGVESGDWQNLKETDPDKADEWIDQFSNHVFEKIVSTCDYLELCDSNKALFIHCHADTMSRLCLSISSGESEDLLARLLDPSFDLPFDTETIFDQIPYSSDGRNQDVFKLLNLGFTKSDGKLYKKVSLHYAATRSTE